MSNPAARVTSPQCPICHAPSRYIFTSKHTRPIHACTSVSCKHFFTPVMDAVQGICARAEEIELESDDFLRRFDGRNVRLLSLFQRHMRPANARAVMLDFGAGSAHISRTFKRLLGDRAVIYALEPNPVCADLYRKYGLVQIIDLVDLPEKVDLIYMVEVVEHLEDPIRMLSALKERLTADGAIFISTPAGAEKESLTHAYDTASHLHFFTQTSLNLALRAAGLQEIVSQHYPELYPTNRGTDGLRNVIRLAKTLTKSVLANLRLRSSNGGHLVGFTKSQ